MTNKEKAEEIANNESLYVETDNLSKVDECRIAAMTMAEWKDKQFAKEKAALINRLFQEFEFENFTYVDINGNLDFENYKFSAFLERVSGVIITE